MKKNIHPQLFQTIIQNKNGSLFIKNWLFFKSTLILENDINTYSFIKKIDKNTLNKKKK